MPHAMIAEARTTRRLPSQFIKGRLPKLRIRDVQIESRSKQDGGSFSARSWRRRRQRIRTKAPRPEANSGNAPGSGVGLAARKAASPLEHDPQREVRRYGVAEGKRCNERHRQIEAAGQFEPEDAGARIPKPWNEGDFERCHGGKWNSIANERDRRRAHIDAHVPNRTPPGAVSIVLGRKSMLTNVGPVPTIEPTVVATPSKLSPSA
jgi:hypothetical protein